MPSASAYALRVGGELLAYLPGDGIAAHLGPAADPRPFVPADVGGEDPRLPRPRSGPPAPPFVGLVTTRSCRMACSYCDFASTREAVVMTPGTASAAVDVGAGLAAAAGNEELEVHLFGGEPFDAWRTVRTAVERARAAADRHGLGLRFEATTSGNFGPERARWVGATLHRVVLSVDGPPALHDRTRPTAGGLPSSPVVLRTAEILSDATCDLVLRMCVTAESAEAAGPSVEWLLERFRPSTVCLEPVRADDGATGAAPPGPSAFLRAFADATRVCDARHVELVFSGADLTRCDVSPCPVARDGFVVQPEGSVAACYLPPERWRSADLELTWGRLAPDGGLEIDGPRLAAVRGLVAGADGGCRSCFCRWHCAGGCRVSRPSGPRRPDRDPWCLTARAVTAWQLAHRLGADAAVLLERPEVESWRLAPEES